MTELRENVEDALVDFAESFKAGQGGLTEATDAIMALFAGGSATGSFDFLDFLRRKNSWSEDAFGPVEHRGPLGPLDHLRKEIAEAEADPGDAMEFADLVFLATDAAHRAGHTPEALAKALEDKLEINRARDWGDWRTKPADMAIEHNREGEPVIDRPAPVVVKDLAFIAGGSGEVSEEAKTQALAAGGVVFFEQAGAFEDAVIAALTAAYTIDRPASAVDRYVESRLEKQREADAFHMGIDRPAPVVVKPPHFIEAAVGRWRFTHLFGDAEIVQTAPSTYRLDVCFNDELDGKTFSSLKGAEEAFAADYTRRILSAVNRVSAMSAYPSKSNITR